MNAPLEPAAGVPAEPRHADDVLARTTAAALAVSGVEGPELFAELAARLAAILRVDATLIAVFSDTARTRLKTLAAWLDGSAEPNFEYELATTPCRSVVGRESRFIGSGVHHEFRENSMLSALGFDSYAAHSMMSAGGEQIGMVVAMSRRAMADQQLTEALLKIFATRAAAEVERSRAEQSYRAILESAEDAIFVHDWDTGAILDVSPKASDLYGHPREALRGMRVRQISEDVPPYTEAEALAHMARAKECAGPLRFEWRGRHRDGHLMWQEVTLKRAVLAGERRVLAFVRDVTERKRAEEALRRSEAQYRDIFNASADAMVLWDSRYRRVDVNTAYQKMYGWAREDVIGKAYEDPRFPADYAEERLDLVRRALAGEDCQAELEAICADGSRIKTEVHAIPFRHRGEPHVLAIARDITDRKAAEQALQMREQQYRAIFDGSADAMVLWNDALRIVDVNRTFVGMYGFARDEVIGTRFGELIPTVDVEPRLARLRRALQGEEQSLDISANHRDGSRFDVELRYLPIQHLGAPHVLAIARDITERKRAEDALRQSEEQHRTLFNASVDGMLVKDAANIVVDVNDAFLRMHGFAREELVGHCLLDFLPPDLRTHCLELLPAVLAGTPCHFEAQTWRRDRTVLDVEIHGVRVVYGGEARALVIMRDITERKRAEAALRGSEAQYRAIFDVSADALMLWDSHLKRVDVNPAHQKIFGYRRDEVVGRGFEALDYPPELAQPRLERVRRALAGEASRAEVEAQRKGGQRIVTELRTIPFTHGGEPHVLQIARDITEQKRAEDALRVSEARYRLLFDTESDALVLVDVETLRLVDVNQAAVTLYGRSREELLRMTAPDLSAQPEETRRSIQQAEGPLDIPVRMHRDSSGRTFPVEIKANRLLLDGRMTVVAAIRDISERQQLEAQLRQAQKMEAIGQLAGGIAHDFNNILTSILGYVVLAQERAADAADARSEAHLEQAMAGCRRARDLVQQLLTFARGQRVQPAAVDLCALVRDAVPLLRASIPATIDLHYDCDVALPPARADRVQIDQVLLNLVLNARDALERRGRGSIAIGLALRDVHGVCSSCRQRVDGRFVELAVSDDGPGMEPSLADRVFEPFFSTKTPGSNSGMGLATVHGIAHDHGGHVLLQTTMGGGASFRVLLPQAQGQAPADRQPAPAARPPAASRRLRGRVLVVDDEPSVREFLAELLGGWGLDVQLAADGRDGLDRIVAERFDLVLSDQTMPGLDGLALAHALTTLPDPPPLLLMSGLAGLMQTPLQSAGVRALLAKPLEPAALFDELRRHLPAG